MEIANHTLLCQGSADLGVSLDERQVQLLEQYLDILNKWNKNINLTAVREEKGQVVKLLLDSMALVSCLSSYNKESRALVVDIGSGAGLPGVPLKIALPDLEVALVESRQKRTRFLNDVVRELGLQNIRVFEGRAEDKKLMGWLGRPADFVVARAVGDIGLLAELSAPLLKSGGILIAPKGAQPDPEIEEHQKTIAKRKMSVETINYYSLPEGGGNNSLVILRKS